MNKEELLKEIMKLPKTKTDNPITTMNSINVDDLMSAVDRLNKVPDYNDLLKENKELKQKYENAVADYETTMAEKEQLKKQLDKYENPEDMTLMMMWCTEKVKDENQELKRQNDFLMKRDNICQMLETQQKEFIKYLENKIFILHDEMTELSVGMCNTDYQNTKLKIYQEVEQKYKETIGE